MNESILAVPVGLCLAGSLLAVLLRGRASNVTLGWLLASAPLTAFAVFASFVPAIANGGAIDAAWDWIPALRLRFSLHLDGLGLLFALLVSGIGAVIVVYAGYYFAPHGAGGGAHHANDARFFAYILLFMASMLGLVIAGDIVTLFIFWEGTSIVSFLLVAYKTKDAAARAGAFKALFFTGGGVALLAGLVMISAVAGSTDLGAIIAQGNALRAHELYGVMLGLVALGAFTKSAQFPAHSWLPDAMSAPTPASAYLHSATMVKAGIYLMARLYPALGGTEAWFWLLTGTGAITMLLGAVLGLRQNDLKALLAYSTISQLGALMLLIGQPVGEAFKALVIGVLAHALYKGALFLVTGIVDHSAGTRDLRALGGLGKAMPITFGIAIFAGLSMGGLPPLLGFLAKETLLATKLHHELQGIIALLLPIAGVLTGALLLCQALILVVDTFRTPAPETSALAHAHDPALGMWIGPALLAALSLLLVIPLQGPTDLLAAAAKAAFGEKVKVSLALWTGFNAPLLLSALAITLGIGLFALRARLFPRSPAHGLTRHPALLDAPYRGALKGLDGAAWLATRVQNGSVRRYMAIMLAGVAALFAWFGALQVSPSLSTLRFEFPDSPATSLVRIFALALVLGASIVSVILRNDLFAILALGASGLAMAMLIALEPSPDVALVQIIVDILTTVVLVLALGKMPRAARAADKRPTGRRRSAGLRLNSLSSGKEAALALMAGLAMTVICLTALNTRPRESIVTPYYEANSKPLTGAADIVGAIVVDFRGFDTMIEITVFSMAGIGVYTLLQHARKKHDANLPPPEMVASQPLPERIAGIGGWRTSSFVHALAYVVLPLAFVVGVIHILYGHDQPGDGFTAGVIISLAIAFWYVTFGYDATRQHLPWLRPHVLIGIGILTVMSGSIAPALMGGAFFAPVDFGQLLGLPLPDGVFLSTSTMFELAICLAVMGGASYILDSLGHPERR